MIIKVGITRPIPTIPIKLVKIFPISIRRPNSTSVAVSIEGVEDVNIIEASPKNEPERVTQAVTPRRCKIICVKTGRNCSPATNLSNRRGGSKSGCAHKNIGDEQADSSQPKSDSEPRGRAGEGPISLPLVSCRWQPRQDPGSSLREYTLETTRKRCWSTFQRSRTGMWRKEKGCETRGGTTFPTDRLHKALSIS